MKYLILFIFLLSLSAQSLLAQGVGINQSDPDTSAVLDIVSINKGVLIPRMTSAQRAAIPLPAKGLMVFDSTTTSFWFYDGLAWGELGASTSASDSILTEADGDTRIMVGDDNGEDKIRFTIKGSNIMTLDSSRLEIGRDFNTMIGVQAGESTTPGPGVGIHNTFLGAHAGKSNTNGESNVFIGASAGRENATGDRNVMLGESAGKHATSSQNVYVGYNAGLDDSLGLNNTFVGASAGSSIGKDRSNSNAFFGYGAGGFIELGYDNVLLGSNALWIDTLAIENTIIGSFAGLNQKSSIGNIYIGYQTAGGIVHGSNNIIIGNRAGPSDSTCSNKLFIENSISPSPLIYGDFADDTLRVNGTFDIRGRYSFPDSNGAVGRTLLVAPGAKKLDWGFPTKLRDDFSEISVSQADKEIRFDIDGVNQLRLGQNDSGLLQMTFSNNNRDNIFMGTNAGQNSHRSAWGNTFLGSYAGENNTEGYANLLIGEAAGYNITGQSNENVMLGANAGTAIKFGQWNTIVGTGALALDTAGILNVIVGYKAGYSHESATGNVYVGAGAGIDNKNGAYNVFIGNNAGFHETGSSRLYISNDSAQFPLIYGEFDNEQLGINGKLGIGTQSPQRSLHLTASSDPLLRIETSSTSGTGIEFLNGGGSNDWKIQTSSSAFSIFQSDNNFTSNTRVLDLFKNGSNYRLEPFTAGQVSLGSSSYPYSNVYAQSGTVQTSDRRMKKNIQNLGYGLETVMAMRPVSFDWINRSDEHASLGFIAQEMEEVVPEVVVHQITPAGVDKQGNERPESDTYAMKYSELIPVLVKAVQEQQAQIEQLQAELDALKNANQN